MRKLILLPIVAVLFFASPVPPVHSQNQPQITYVASKRSDKFHRPTCRYARRIAEHNLRVFKSREEAVKRGYVPCKMCRP